MGAEGLLKTYPKDRRTCNLGTCPAFHLEPADILYLIAAEAIRKEHGIEAAVEALGVPSGTCLARNVEVVVNSACTATDNQFINYVKKRAGQ